MRSLNTISPGEKCKIISIDTTPAFKRRLNDLGFIENSVIECLFKSFWGDPAAYNVKGAVIALRNIDAAKIFVDIWEEANE